MGQGEAQTVSRGQAVKVQQILEGNNAARNLGASVLLGFPQSVQAVHDEKPASVTQDQDRPSTIDTEDSFDELVRAHGLIGGGSCEVVQEPPEGDPDDRQWPEIPQQISKSPVSVDVGKTATSELLTVPSIGSQAHESSVVSPGDLVFRNVWTRRVQSSSHLSPGRSGAFGTKGSWYTASCSSLLASMRRWLSAAQMSS